MEIADIDNPIGFKGNYQIFPLKLNNPLTIYMMQEYIQIEDGEIGLRDPDTQGAFDVEAFKAHVQEVFEIEGEEEFNRTHRKQFEEMYLKYLTSGYIQNEEIIIPTKSLFIEALPSSSCIGRFQTCTPGDRCKESASRSPSRRIGKPKARFTTSQSKSGRSGY
ncbi:MAG: hypothetical protein IPG01_10565 [Chitinophagaceae bacterium]|nr:hypothetical protein [Chitinophagaceae bacterium]